MYNINFYQLLARIFSKVVVSYLNFVFFVESKYKILNFFSIYQKHEMALWVHGLIWCVYRKTDVILNTTFFTFCLLQPRSNDQSECTNVLDSEAQFLTEKSF